MTMNMPPLSAPDEINKIIDLARQAGQIALRNFQKVNPQFKQDQTFVTSVDLEIEYFLASKIKAIYPDHNFIGEETGPHHQTDTVSKNTWVIDPIDGTTAFVQGLPGWGVSIGLLHQNRPHFGLFYMPLLDDLTYTTHQKMLYCNGRLLQQPVRKNWGQKGFLAVNASLHYEYKIKTQRIRAMGSIGANLVYTARGAAVGALISKAYLWDLVAGAAILNCAGGELRYIDAQPLDYLTLLDGRLAPAPIIAAHPDMQAELRAIIKDYEQNTGGKK